MHVERYGTGDHLFLCLHGWSGNHSTFAPLAAQLPAGVTLWCPDIPNGATLADVTHQLAAFAVTLPGPLRILGNCSGALHGLLLAERMPVEQIVMIDAFAYWPLYFRMFLLPVWGRWAYMTAFANPVGRWFANLSMARHRTGDTNLTAGFSSVDHAAAYRHLHLLREIGSPLRFRGLAARVDIACGERSFAAIRTSAQIWQEVFPKARQYVLAGAGPLPLLEAAGQVRSIIFEDCFKELPCPI